MTRLARLLKNALPGRLDHPYKGSGEILDNCLWSPLPPFVILAPDERSDAPVTRAHGRMMLATKGKAWPLS
jgi:hypothetical protein